MLRSLLIFALTLGATITTLKAAGQISHAYPCPDVLQVEMPEGVQLYCDFTNPKKVADSAKNVALLKEFLSFLRDEVLVELRDMDQLPWDVLEGQKNSVIRSALRELKLQREMAKRLKAVVLSDRDHITRVFAQVEPTGDGETALHVRALMPGMFGGFSNMIPKDKEELKSRLFRSFAYPVPAGTSVTQFHD